MAIDTQEKRMAASGAGRPYMRGKLPGANDQEWRIASGNGYGGNSIAGAPTATILDYERGFRRGCCRGLSRGMA
jgi:hypothetical protein